MADPLGGLEKIVKLALSIKRAVETVRRNKEECNKIQKLASRISEILRDFQEATGVVNTPAMSGLLEDLSETVDRALTLVTECQERHGFVTNLCTAGNMAMLLREVQEDMDRKMMTVTFANSFASNIASSGVLRHPSCVAVPYFLPRSPSVPVPCVLPRPSSVPEGGASQVATVSRPARVRAEAQGMLVEEVKERQMWGSLSCTKFSLSELEAATHNFSSENLVGQGSSAFVAVCKGVLHDEREVLIKKIQCHDNNHEEEICDKIRFVLDLKHKNIVQLLGFGYTKQNRAEMVGDSDDDNDYYVFLVEEYMANGSLDNIIYGSQHDWSSRLRLIQGIAHGLHYLHEQQIVHLDLKPNNILVDSDMNPKIAVFGRARMLLLALDGILPGTMGYMPPEYIMEGIVSMMYDVYSFGVILLETISGMCRSEPARHQASIEWAWIAREGGRMEELLDLPLCSESQQKEVRRCLEVGLLCTQADQADRPTMLDVVEMLDCKKELPTPKQPKYIKVPRN